MQLIGEFMYGPTTKIPTQFVFDRTSQTLLGITLMMSGYAIFMTAPSTYKDVQALTHFFPPACTLRSQCCADVPLSKQTQLLSIVASVSEYVEIVNDVNGRFEYIKLNLTSRYDKNSPIHPITNPQYTLTTRVSPLGHSR